MRDFTLNLHNLLGNIKFMANKALLGAARKVAEEQKVENDARKESLERSKATKHLPKILNLRAGEPFRISTLTTPDNMLELWVHIDFIEGRNGRKGYYEYSLCNKTLQQADPSYPDCKTCKEFNSYGDNKRSILVKAIPSYVHSNEGKEFTDPQTGKSFPLKTEKIVLLRAVKGMANFNVFDELNRKNSFTVPGKYVFEIKRTGTGKEDTVYHPLVKVHPDDLGDEFDPNSEEARAAREAWSKKSDDEIWQIILSNFKAETVDWDAWGLEEPKEDVVDSEDNKSTPMVKKSKNDLESK